MNKLKEFFTSLFSGHPARLAEGPDGIQITLADSPPAEKPDPKAEREVYRKADEAAFKQRLNDARQQLAGTGLVAARIEERHAPMMDGVAPPALPASHAVPTATLPANSSFRARLAKAGLGPDGKNSAGHTVVTAPPPPAAHTHDANEAAARRFEEVGNHSAAREVRRAGKLHAYMKERGYDPSGGAAPQKAETEESNPNEEAAQRLRDAGKHAAASEALRQGRLHVSMKQNGGCYDPGGPPRAA